MKKLLTGLMVLVLCAGLFGVSSLLYAADPEPVESVVTQVEYEDCVILLGCDDLRRTEPEIYYHLLSVAEQAEAWEESEAFAFDEDGFLSVELTDDSLVCVLTENNVDDTDEEAQSVTVVPAERNEDGDFVTGLALRLTPPTEASPFEYRVIQQPSEPGSVDKSSLVEDAAVAVDGIDSDDSDPVDDGEPAVQAQDPPTSTHCSSAGSDTICCGFSRASGEVRVICICRGKAGTWQRCLDTGWI